MSFLQPILLFGLPLALLPVIIHLINQHRHRTVRWAAMMFLLDAKKMTKGLARLRQILILAMRVLAVATLVFAASRPLSGGWLGFTGGGADTILVLLDRSASMEQQNLSTGESKRSTALARIADLVEKTGRSAEILLIDSATLTPVRITDPQSLRDLPETAPTDTTADIPLLLRAGLDSLQAQGAGRTDIWLASDLRQSDWNSAAGEWESIRADIAARETVRLFLLAFPEAPRENVSLHLRDLRRMKSPGGLTLLLDFTIRREGGGTDLPAEVPVEFFLNGTRTVETFSVAGEELNIVGHTLELGPGNERGWGRLDLPADGNNADNRAWFVFDEPAPRKTTILSDDALTAEAIRAAASAPVDAGVLHQVELVATNRVSELDWQGSALLFWQAPLPAPESAEAALLTQHLESGRSLVLLPPPDEAGAEWAGVSWGEWTGGSDEAMPIEWWRTETGLLANTRSGSPLPVSEISVFRSRAYRGETLPLLKLAGDRALVSRVLADGNGGDERRNGTGGLHIWGTLPRIDHSNLATEGVVFFVMIQRALEAGADSVSRARLATAGLGALSGVGELRDLAEDTASATPVAPGLAAGAWESGTGENARLVALNRPESEDDSRILDAEAIDGLLVGVDYRRIDDQVGSGNSLAAEVWRAFLFAMAIALLAEALLSLPPRLRDEPRPDPLRSET